MSAPAPRPRTPAHPVTWPLRLVRSLLRFLLEVVVANLRVAREVATPGFSMQAAIIAVPTRTRTRAELVTLANAISLTPGTLTLEADEERGTLYVHTLYAPSREEFLADVARLEDVVLDAMRPRGGRA